MTSLITGEQALRLLPFLVSSFALELLSDFLEKHT